MVNWVIVGLTAVLAVMAFLQWRIYCDILSATKTTERAYVSMSHVPPGLQFVDPSHDIRATIRISNTGHTPADIIGYDVRLAFGPLVTTPDRPAVPSGPPQTYIMPSDHIDLWLNFPGSMFQMTDVRTGNPELYLVGWVVYGDRFGRRHRSGYGRRFIVPIQEGGNNLVFIQEPGYNYEEDLV